MKESLEGLNPFTFEGAIFDFDGTIAASGFVWHKVDKLFLESRGIEWTPDFAPKIAALGFKDGAQYVIDEYGFSDTCEEICNEWNDLAKDLYATEVFLHPGALEYIEKLKSQGIPCALASTNNQGVLSALKPRIDVWDIFDQVVLGDEVERTKHFPDIYLEAARRINVNPSGCVAFEDIIPGVKSAQTAGMCAVGVYSHDESQPVDELCTLADRFIIDWQHLL